MHLLRNRVLYLGIIGFSALSLMTACGGSDSSQGENAGESTAASENTDTAYSDAVSEMVSTQLRIDALDPEKPDDLGTVGELVYRGLSFETPDQELIFDDDVDQYIEEHLLAYTTTEVTDRGAEEGDTVNIDYVGTLDGAAFDGGSYEGYNLTLGSGSFIEGFEEGLIGARTGDTVVLELSFPEDYYNEDLAGQLTEFTVTVNEIYRPMTMDEFSDEAIEQMSDGEYTSVEEYKSDLKDYLQAYSLMSFKSSLYSNALYAAVEASELEPTDEAVEWQLDMTLKNYDASLQSQGTNLGYYLYYYGIGYDDYRDAMYYQGVEAAKEALLIYEVSDIEGLEFNDETAQQYIKEFGYEVDSLDDILDESAQELTVLWYLTGKLIADNGNVTYTSD